MHSARVLGEDIVAPRDNPPWNNSAMDGFAVRWEDIKKDHAITKPAELEVVEDVPAGQVATKPWGPGQAIRIMTGAPMPTAPIPSCALNLLNRPTPAFGFFNRNPREPTFARTGEDVQEGDCIIPTGTQLRPAEIGMLAILAKSFVVVHQRPRVAILSTG